MTTNDLLQALARLRVETGSLACLGCGHEHNCSTHGCAILRAAADLIERLTAERDALREKMPRWICVADRHPKPGTRVLATDGVFVGEAYRTSADTWHGGSHADDKPPRQHGDFCQYCGQRLRTIGTARFCNNVNCKNRFEDT